MAGIERAEEGDAAHVELRAASSCERDGRTGRTDRQAGETGERVDERNDWVGKRWGRGGPCSTTALNAALSYLATGYLHTLSHYITALLCTVPSLNSVIESNKVSVARREAFHHPDSTQSVTAPIASSSKMTWISNSITVFGGILLAHA